MIKPDVMNTDSQDDIIHMAEEAGFIIMQMRDLRMSLEQAQDFYGVHKDKPFFDSLCEFMSSGSCMVLHLSHETEDAVPFWRKTIGATNPEEAEEGTIRSKHGTSIDRNAVHGSDSDDNAEREISFFFGLSEKYSTTSRGFRLIEFEDRYRQKCSLQDSSLASEAAIWLGVDNTGPCIEGPNGKMNEDVHRRMHLTVGQVRDLIPLLQEFCDKGFIPKEK